MNIDDPDDSDANLFNDTLTAFGLKQHIDTPTHYKGNILDLILMEITSHTVGKVQTGAMLSDHTTVYASLNIEKSQTHKGKTSIHKISAITDGALCQEIYKLQRVMDMLAPTKEVTMITHNRQPWYDEYVKAQHKIVRNHERKWYKYKSDCTWKAYMKEQYIYNCLLRFTKCQVLHK